MWNADVYNCYGRERIQPSIDLVNRMRGKIYNRILDAGCGTGMSTASIMTAWADSEIIGVDLSEEMLERARKDIPEILFLQKDCSKSLSELGTFDLIFSNAFMQWIPNQEEFMKNSFQMLNIGGDFAAQIPLFDEMPANQCIIDAKQILTNKLSNNVPDKFQFYSAEKYYDMIAKYADEICVWVTDYFHEMDDHQKILDFLKGAALHPYMEILNKCEQEVFLHKVLSNIKVAYPSQENGKVLFPFKRLFLIGTKLLQ